MLLFIYSIGNAFGGGGGVKCVPLILIDPDIGADEVYKSGLACVHMCSEHSSIAV